MTDSQDICLIPDRSPLQSAVWGAWENVCGPRVQCRFSRAPDSALSMEEACSLVKVALSYHLKDTSRINYFQVCDFGGDLGLCGFSCVYSATAACVMNCIVGVFPRSFFPRLTLLTSTLGAFWMEWMDLLKVHHHVSSSETVAEQLGLALSALVDLLGQVETLRQLHVSPSDLWPIRFQDGFVQRCIASHLATFGRSLVVGTDAGIVNHMIRVLQLFSLPQRKELTVFLAPDEPHRRFHAELFLQGLLWRQSTGRKFPVGVWDVLRSDFPLTVVDMVKKEVHRSSPLLVHRKRRAVFVAAAVSAFLDSGGAGGDVFAAHDELRVDSLMTDAPVQSVEVDRGCAELQRVSADADQVEGAVGLLMRQLAVKARALLAFVDAAQRKGDGTIPRRPLWAAVNVATEGDFLIVQALAEQVRPGLIAALDRACTDAHA